VIRGKPEYSEKNTVQCHFIGDKHHMDYPDLQTVVNRMIPDLPV
jgi:hypothetical protein